MASYWIKTRLTKDGSALYVVGYRLGGRGTREFHAASVASRTEAEKILAEVQHRVAAGQFVNRDKLRGSGRPELVYFARLGDLVKIGVSVSPERPLSRKPVRMTADRESLIARPFREGL